MIKVKKVKLWRQLASLAKYRSEKNLTDLLDFELVVATDSQEVGKEFAELLGVNSQKEVSVFSLDSLPKDHDLLVFLLLDWNEENLLKIQELAKVQANYLVVSLAHSYLSLAFREGREAGIPSHRVFVWNQDEDYEDFFKGALKLAGEKKFALARSYPVFLPFLKELIVTNAAFNLGWSAFRSSPSFFLFFIANFKNFKQLASLSDSNTVSKEFFFLVLISLPTTFFQMASTRFINSQNGKLVRALSTGLSTFLAYRLITSDFLKKKV